MNELELIQEVRERLIRIEGKIENANDKHKTLEKRVNKLEENNTWLTRAIIGQIIGIIVAFFIK
ncbi:hemolysin XhlA family protein [Clostridium sporogenes]|uniref:hemolysin XhlA family protein n=1 Tax=Clostridium sporogenes TaxID=1509 RepID=UPI003F92ED53|nr:hemolysin XhlA family protein [Clostridium botulinum]